MVSYGWGAEGPVTDSQREIEDALYGRTLLDRGISAFPNQGVMPYRCDEPNTLQQQAICLVLQKAEDRVALDGKTIDFKVKDIA